MGWNVKRRLGLILIAGALAGCEVSDDPAQGGFLSGLYNLSTGGYEERLGRRQDELTEIEKANSTGLTELTDLRQTEQELASVLTATEGRLAGLDEDVVRAIKALDEAEIGAGADRDLLKVLRADLQSVEAERANLGADPAEFSQDDLVRLGELEAKTALLLKTLDEAIFLSVGLGK